MNMNLKKWMSLGLVMVGMAVLTGCGGSASPVVIGDLLAPVAIPTNTSSWLEKSTDNGTEKNIETFYLNGNNIVAIKSASAIGTITEASGFTSEIINDTIVLGQQASLAKITTTQQGNVISFYLNSKIDNGTVTISGSNVTATYTLIIAYSSDTTQTVARTTTLTGTVSADGRTFNFTRSNTQTTPSQPTDGDKDVTITWTLQTGNTL
jgi:hypothetical protein